MKTSTKLANLHANLSRLTWKMEDYLECSILELSAEKCSEIELKLIKMRLITIKKYKSRMDLINRIMWAMTSEKLLDELVIEFKKDPTEKLGFDAEHINWLVEQLAEDE